MEEHDASKTKSLRKCNTYQYLLQNNPYMYSYQNLPALLPLPPPTPFHSHTFRPKPHNRNNPPPATSSVQPPSLPRTSTAPPQETPRKKPHRLARRPDSGGTHGKPIALLANHFLVRFDPSQRIFHYDVVISPSPSKEIARAIKQKLVADHSSLLSGSRPVYDGRKTIYSPVEFRSDRLEFHITLPPNKIFRVSIKLVSKLDGEPLRAHLMEKDDFAPLPQEYIHALDVVLRENPLENCIATGNSFYSKSMGEARGIGGGAVAYTGFFQSLRPTQQGLALNVDFSVTAFHEGIGVIPYLQKRFDFMSMESPLSNEERKEVEKALKNMRVLVCHRDTSQRYRVHGLTEEVADDLWFPDRDGGEDLKLVDYFKNHYGYDLRYLKLPCLQISRRKACYLPMELCVICEGQKFFGKLSDDQTARLMKMSCQRPMERKGMIDQVIKGRVGPTSGNQENEFNLQVTKEMTRLTGRILHPPKLMLGHGGNVTNLTPTRRDCQWNLLDSHVLEGTCVERWALISFGGTSEQRSSIPNFISKLSQKCHHLGIFLNPNTVINPIFESVHILNNPKLLESKLKKIHKATSYNLRLLVCVMERKHKGYADLKRICETGIGVMTQCCLYLNLGKLSSQFLANVALKINVKIGGCTVALYNSLPSQMPRVFRVDEPVIFMGADVTHPHPSDDSSPSVAAVVGSINWPAANKYISRMRSQKHREEIIQELSPMVREILNDYREELSRLPTRIIFFRDGVSETQFDKVLEQEMQSIRHACTEFLGGSYNPPITFVVVQKRHHTRLFPCENDRFDENISPGTVVDTVIAHPTEFDFYLCSHWGVKGTSRPIHYHVLLDESEFTSDEVQGMVYNLCYTFVRCTKPVSLVPPAYYAHLAAYRGRLYLERSDLGRFGSSVSRASIPETVALPQLSESIRKLMFYC